jgi:hypothetical protein
MSFRYPLVASIRAHDYGINIIWNFYQPVVSHRYKIRHLFSHLMKVRICAINVDGIPPMGIDPGSVFLTGMTLVVALWKGFVGVPVDVLIDHACDKVKIDRLTLQFPEAKDRLVTQVKSAVSQ